MSNVSRLNLRNKYNMGLCVLISSSLIVSAIPSPVYSHCLTPNPMENKILYGDFFDLLYELDAKKGSDDVNGTIEILFRIKAQIERMSGVPISMKKYLKKLSKGINRNGDHISKAVMKSFSGRILFIEHLIEKGMGDAFNYVDRKFDESNPNWRNPYVQEHDHHPKITIGITMALAGLFCVCLPVIAGISFVAIGSSLITAGASLAGYEILDEFCEENWEPKKK